MNESELIIVETPNGYKAYLKPKLTFGEVKQFKRASLSSVEYDTETKKSIVSMSAIIDGSEAALRLFLVKLIDPQGKILENPSEAINAIDAEDGEAIENKVSELSAKIELDKKKLTS